MLGNGKGLTEVLITARHDCVEVLFEIIQTLDYNA